MGITASQSVMSESTTRSRIRMLAASGATILPGLLLCAVIAVASYALADWPALNHVIPLSPLMMAILIGVVIRSVVPIPSVFEPGIRWTLYWVLRAGIVLLGSRLVLQDMLGVGVVGLLVLLLLVSATISFSVWLGRRLGLSDSLSLLIGAGTGICGASAVVAVDGVIRAHTEHVSVAVALATAFGTLAMLVYPVLAHCLSMDSAQFSIWAGSSIHEVAQVVATGFAFSNQAGVGASLYKLCRVAMLLPACAAVAFWWRRRAAEEGGTGGGKRPFPMFVIAFVGVVAINSMIRLPDAVHGAIVDTDTALLTTAMAAMGLQTRVMSIVRLGWRPVLLSAVTTLCMSLAGLAAAMLLGA